MAGRRFNLCCLLALRQDIEIIRNRLDCIFDSVDAVLYLLTKLRCFWPLILGRGVVAVFVEATIDSISHVQRAVLTSGAVGMNGDALIFLGFFRQLAG